MRQFGRLQGLKSAEIEARLADVEAFADIGDFFDRPVKTYSSGMFARIAFAAAINVDPDILVLDEILAVGDARFQVRCFDRIRSMQDGGKTVLVVSHSIETIIDQCDSAVLLNGGKVIATGDPKSVTDVYRELLFDETFRQLGAVMAPRPAVPDAASGPTPASSDYGRRSSRISRPPIRPTTDSRFVADTMRWKRCGAATRRPLSITVWR